MLVLPLAVYFAAGQPLTLTYPNLGALQHSRAACRSSGIRALCGRPCDLHRGLHREVVRAGIQAVSKGQTEASYALGLKPGPTLDLVVIPAGDAGDHSAAHLRNT